MKKMLLVFAVVLLSSCSTLSPVGNWDYSVTGTPDGDRAGTMTVAKKDKKTYGAVLKTEEGELKFDKFQFVSKTKKSTGEFNYQGMIILFDAKVTENEMTGSVSTQGTDFPFKATRKK
jgi:hypothetical protein